MSRAKIVNAQDGSFYAIRVSCPGCRWADGEPMAHTLETEWMPPGATRTAHARPDRWGFNGDFERPTFSPSLLRRSGRPGGEHVCHSFIRNGRIEFLADCTHALAGQTVDLPEICE